MEGSEAGGASSRSMPASRARRRLAGEVMIRPVGAVAGAAAGVADAARGAAALCAPAGIARAAVLAASPLGASAFGASVLGASPGLAPAGAAAPTSNTISGEPTATLSPGPPVMETTLPLTGAGTSTAALSVITSTMI